MYRRCLPFWTNASRERRGGKIFCNIRNFRISLFYLFFSQHLVWTAGMLSRFRSFVEGMGLLESWGEWIWYLASKVDWWNILLGFYFFLLFCLLVMGLIPLFDLVFLWEINFVLMCVVVVLVLFCCWVLRARRAVVVWLAGWSGGLWELGSLEE